MGVPRVMLITDLWTRTQFPSQVATFISVDSGTVPSLIALAEPDLVLVFGPLRDAERAVELAGALKLALEKGATIVFAYGARFDTIDSRFADAVAEVSGTGTGGSVSEAASKPPPHPAFREYITLHGQADWQFVRLPEGADALAHAVVAASPYTTSPSAIQLHVSKGSVFFVPYHTAGDHQLLLERLVLAVRAHQEGRLASLPAFFDELQLPGEEAIVGGIAEARATLEQLEGERAALTRHKLLIGHSSGGALEELVIEELNLALGDSGLKAQDTEERRVEDFEIVDAAGERKAIAESKAASGGVTLVHVNQLNSHRSEHFDAAADELPGLLVVNTFRNDDSLERRQRPVDERVVRHAARINVLVLRTWDLFQLVVRRLNGQDDSDKFQRALKAGGWLEVAETGLTHHAG